MKKILFVMNNLGAGGAERVLVDILDSFDYSEYEVDLFLINYKGVYIDAVNKNVNVYKMYGNLEFKNKKLENLHLNIKYRLLKHFPKFMYKLFIRKEYDVEISFLEGFPATYLLANSSNGKSKKIAWVHTDLSKSRSLSLEEEGKMYSNIDKIVCVSNDCKESFLKIHSDFKDKVEVIYNLILKDNIISKGNEKIESISQEPIIIGVGRLEYVKRFDLLIKAHKLLMDDGMKNSLLIIGGGQEETSLKNLVKELNVEDSVFILGYKTNPYAYIKASDVFVSCSDYEGFSLVVAESLILGKPIISTRCVGPVELLGNGDYGILIDNNDEIALKEELKKLLSDDSLLKKYASLSRERSEVFDKNLVMNQIYNIINGNDI